MVLKQRHVRHILHLAGPYPIIHVTNVSMTICRTHDANFLSCQSKYNLSQHVRFCQRRGIYYVHTNWSQEEMLHGMTCTVHRDLLESNELESFDKAGKRCQLQSRPHTFWYPGRTSGRNLLPVLQHRRTSWLEDKRRQGNKKFAYS